MRMERSCPDTQSCVPNMKAISEGTQTLWAFFESQSHISKPERGPQVQKCHAHGKVFSRYTCDTKYESNIWRDTVGMSLFESQSQISNLNADLKFKVKVTGVNKFVRMESCCPERWPQVQVVMSLFQGHFKPGCQKLYVWAWKGVVQIHMHTKYESNIWRDTEVMSLFRIAVADFETWMLTSSSRSRSQGSKIVCAYAQIWWKGVVQIRMHTKNESKYLKGHSSYEPFSNRGRRFWNLNADLKFKVKVTGVKNCMRMERCCQDTHAYHYEAISEETQ